MKRRKLLVPEVVQTSAMDCGPASLKCLLEGHGIQVSYNRLREACQTDIDGTSIDTLEELAVHFGLDAEQVMIPVDHVLLPEAEVFPAILVVRQPDGSPHFIVLWQRLGSLVQLMDPASGRRWTTTRQLLNDVYAHTSLIPVSKWINFANSSSFLQVLHRRCERLGLEDSGAQLIADATSNADWLKTAVLDAAIRMMESVATSGGLSRGPQLARLLENLVEEANRAAVDGEEVTIIPEIFWTVRPEAITELEDEDEVEDETYLSLKGAVLIAVRGRGVGIAPKENPVVSNSPLAEALHEPDTAPTRELFKLVRASGLMRVSTFIMGIAMAAAGTVVLAVLFSSMLDMVSKLALFEQRLWGLLAILFFLGLMLLIEVPVVLGMQWLSRQIEIRLRIAFLHKLPKLEDRYLRSRPASDMAERCHNNHRIRDLPNILGRFWHHTLEIVLSAVGIVWLYPPSLPVAITAAVATIVAR